MTRVAGTPEARKAWLYLRGPYALGYFFLFAYSLAIPPVWADLVLWKIMVSIVTSMCIFGSGVSFTVAGMGRVTPLRRRLEALEVTGLRMLTAFFLLFGIWACITPTVPASNALTHFAVAGLTGGILMNMTWHKRSTDFQVKSG